MQTIIEIIREAGGMESAKWISIENESSTRLVIEVLAELGPDSVPVVSVAHYGEQDFDLMCDPEVLFQVVVKDRELSELRPFYFRSDYAGAEQWSRYNSETDSVVGLLKKPNARTA